jgi:membrane protease YdiL (CAAX protease family)
MGLPTMRQLNVFPLLGFWAAFCFGVGLYGSWLGYSGRGFAATLTAFAFLLAVMLLFAATGMADFFASHFGTGGGLILGAAAFVAYLIYAIGTSTSELARAGAMATLVLVPLALAVSAKGKPPGAWQDFSTLAGIWVFVKFSPSHWLWPYPGAQLAYIFTVLVALNVALASFVLVRRVNGIGYSIGWGHRWGFYVLAGFVVFGCIAIPLAEGLRFVGFAPRWTAWKSVPLSSIAILVFTAWPEEFFFRGLLQNMLSRALKNDFVGWCLASILFGFSHITNGGFPNWRYVILASIAGLVYGWTWRKSGSIFASALVHTAVNVTWHFLFLTM